jgi:tripartite-type tricarboxylate transporter receptor subunit TctC
MHDPRNLPHRAAGDAGSDRTPANSAQAARLLEQIVDKVAAEMRRILELPEVKDKLFEIGAVASPMTPEDFAKFIEGERTKLAEVVKASGARID